jgi:hypothetical protein
VPRGDLRNSPTFPQPVPQTIQPASMPPRSNCMNAASMHYGLVLALPE